MIHPSERMTHVHSDIRGPLYEEALRMQDRGVSVLKLNTGNPGIFGFGLPDSVRQVLTRHVDEAVPYCDMRGMRQARDVICTYHIGRGVRGIQPDDIFVCNGVSEAVSMLMTALVSAGDEILMPSPCYSLWSNNAYLCGGKPVFYRCDPANEWNPDIDDINSKITDRTKGIVVINPNNPTGALYSREVLTQIVDLAREFDLILFADEIYDRLVMDGAEHVALGSLAPDVMCVNINGLSKSHRVAGYRCGWMCLSGDKSRCKGYIEGLNLLSSMRLCSNVPGQSIIQTALGGTQSADKLLVPGGRVYEQREYIYRALNDIPGISAVKPKAAFYIFPKIDTQKYHILDDERFALDLLREKRILVTHGRGFHWEQPDHFRIVYLPEIEVLQEACGKLEDFLKTYRQ